jgi:hypothetical protein
MVRPQGFSTLTLKKWPTPQPTDQFFFFRKTPLRLGQFSTEKIKKMKLTPLSGKSLTSLAQE